MMEDGDHSITAPLLCFQPLLGREDEIQTFNHSVARGSKTSGLITYLYQGGGGVVLGFIFKFSILYFLDITITHSAPFTP